MGKVYRLSLILALVAYLALAMFLFDTPVFMLHYCFVIILGLATEPKFNLTPRLSPTPVSPSIRFPHPKHTHHRVRHRHTPLLCCHPRRRRRAFGVQRTTTPDTMPAPPPSAPVRSFSKHGDVETAMLAFGYGLDAFPQMGTRELAHTTIDTVHGDSQT